MIGALSVCEERLDWDARDAEVIIGTSAGSIVGALLASGIGVTSLLNHQRGTPGPDDPVIEFDHDQASGGALPPRPRWGIGSSALLARAALRPRRFPPLAAFSAILPHGRGTLASVGDLIDAVVPPGEWAPHPALWVITMDYDRGKRVAFGRPGAPPAPLDLAIMAACAIPGWYAPVVIGGRRYIDGGVCSPASLDLLAGWGLDEILVLAPMVSFEFDDPPTLVGRLERRFRRAVTKRLLREAAKVRRRGSKVTMLGPGRADLEAIGVNLMDPSRRRTVLETSIRTTAEALDAVEGSLAAAG
jgi:NTE family protein